jgi:hypothetical protein
MFSVRDTGLALRESEVGMFDTILGIGASFDWISPLARVLGDLMNGPSYTFLVPYASSPLSGREITWMLSKRGVRSWGHMVVSGTLMISVRLGQARWAQQLLEQAGVPIENPVPAQNRKGPAQGRNPRKKPAGTRQRSRRKSHVGGIVDSVNEILDTRLF